MATDSIGTRIRRARERKRWTQQQLADAIGVNIKSVDNWENGRTSPRNSIGALEEIFGISLDSPLPPDDEDEEIIAAEARAAKILAEAEAEAAEVVAGARRRQAERERRAAERRA